MAESAYLCGDPGMQFDTTVNDWHPCPNTARINASNPCSEYMFLDDSACNLASLNLMRFYNENTGFDVEAYRAALRIVITAQEITVDFASYPTKAIEKNSHAFRPLGIGYANLGALLMARGMPYDSEDGRDYAAAITSILSGESYAQSARIAAKVGPFEGYAVNREPFLRVIDKHRRAAYRINTRPLPADLADAAAQGVGRGLRARPGARLPQRPDLRPRADRHHRLHDGLRHHRHRARHRAGQVQEARRRRHAEDRQPDRPHGARSASATTRSRSTRSSSTSTRTTPSKAPRTSLDAHLTVFDCAFKPRRTARARSTTWATCKMMGAVQPFICGAISKTINMPSDATVEEIELAYHEAWKLGLKAVAVYRDGCKRSPAALHRQGQGEARRRSACAPTAGPAQAPRRARVDHPQVLHQRPRGLHHRRQIRRRHARRDLHHHGQGRLDDLRPHGLLRHHDVPRAPARRPAATSWSTNSPTPDSSPPASPRTPKSP